MTKKKTYISKVINPFRARGKNWIPGEEFDCKDKFTQDYLKRINKIK